MVSFSGISAVVAPERGVISSAIPAHLGEFRRRLQEHPLREVPIVRSQVHIPGHVDLEAEHVTAQYCQHRHVLKHFIGKRLLGRPDEQALSAGDDGVEVLEVSSSSTGTAAAQQAASLRWKSATAARAARRTSARSASVDGTVRSQAESAKLRHVLETAKRPPSSASMAASCARAADSAVTCVPSQSRSTRLPGTRTSHTHRPALPRRRTPRYTGCRVSLNLVRPVGRFGCECEDGEEGELRCSAPAMSIAGSSLVRCAGL